MRYSPALIALVCLSTTASLARAHVTLAERKVEAGSSYRAVLRVPHGCAGSPTTGLRVRIPDGLVGVKPMPKPGWTLTLTRGAYPHPVALPHGTVSEGVREIAWSGGSLPDAHYDEFVFIGTLAKDLPAGTMLSVPVVQECETGVSRWIEAPAAPGAGEAGMPAPTLEVVAPRGR